MCAPLHKDFLATTSQSALHALASFWRSGVREGRRFCFKRNIPWPPIPSSSIVGSLRKESFSLKIANALAKLAPASLKLDVVDAARHFVLQPGSGSRPAGRLAGVPRKAAEVERRAVRHAGIQPLDPRRVEERHRRRLAPLWQELVPRQADRHRQQFAGRARRRQRGQASAEHPAGHCRPDHAASRKST